MHDDALLKSSETTVNVGPDPNEMELGPPSLWYKLLVVRLCYYRSQLQASVATCELFQAWGNSKWTFLSSPMRLWLLPYQRTPLGCNLVPSVSERRRAELGIDTPSRYLAETARAPVSFTIMFR